MTTISATSPWVTAKAAQPAKTTVAPERQVATESPVNIQTQTADNVSVGRSLVAGAETDTVSEVVGTMLMTEVAAAEDKTPTEKVEKITKINKAFNDKTVVDTTLQGVKDAVKTVKDIASNKPLETGAATGAMITASVICPFAASMVMTSLVMLLLSKSAAPAQA